MPHQKIRTMILMIAFVNDIHQVLAYAEDVNLIGDEITTIERNEDVLLNACKDIGFVVNTGKSIWK